MAKHVVIVESPAKAKTIEGYLGRDYRVLASFGHVRDLLAKTGAVDPEQDFAMNYVPVDRNKKHMDAIRRFSKDSGFPLKVIWRKKPCHHCLDVHMHDCFGNGTNKGVGNRLYHWNHSVL